MEVIGQVLDQNEIETLISRLKILSKARYPDGVEPTYHCPKCLDGKWVQTGTGPEGEPLYSRCPCVTRGIVEAAWGADELKKASEEKSFKNFLVSGKPRIVFQAREAAIDFCKTLVQRISENNRHNSIAFLGEPGSGKTHLVFAIANNLQGQDIGCTYWPHIQRFNELRRMVREDLDGYNRVLQQARKTPVLLWDDMFKGRETPTDWVIETVMDIINYRYANKLPVVISSERSAQELLEIDKAVGSRILEMCADYIIELKGANLNHRLRR